MRAGTARIDVTPVHSVWMDGMIRAHPSVGVHDPLFVRALVMANDKDLKQGCAIVSVDVCGLTAQDAQAMRSRVQDRVGIPASQIILAATHTHSGPATVGYFNPAETEYIGQLADKVVQVVEHAAAQVEPVAAGSGSAEEHTISHYRRLLADDGHVVMNWEPYPAEHIVGPLGAIDPEVGVLKLVDEQGQAVCLLFNHAGHPNVLSGDSYLLSAEYPGLAERWLEKELGGTAIFVNGAQGTMDIDGLRDRDWEGMERVGTALAEAAAKAARSIQTSWDATLRYGVAHYTLPARKITDQEWMWAEQVLERTGGSIRALADGVGDDYKATLYRRLRETEGRPIPVEQVCISVADTALLSFPGELFTEIGMAIKASSPFERTFVVGLANGVVGYIPTRRAIHEGGYAVETRRVDADAEDIIVQESLNLLQHVRGSSAGGTVSASEDRAGGVPPSCGQIRYTPPKPAIL